MLFASQKPYPSIVYYTANNRPILVIFCNTVTYNFLTMDPPILNILLPEFSYLNNLGNVRPHSGNYRKCKPVMVSQVMKM